MDCNLRRVTPEEMREIQLRMLNIFADFCEEHHLRYSLGGGTLLGAVRHKGYIPWDDDIDVMMPRPDYEYLIKFFSANNVTLSHGFNTAGHTWLFSKMYDDRTIIAGPRPSRSLYIDIFPIDAVAESDDSQLWKMIERYPRYLLSHYHYIFRRRDSGIFQRVFYTFRWIGSLVYHHAFIFWNYTPKRLFLSFQKEIEKHAFGSTSRSGAIVGLYLKKEIMPTVVFEEYITLPFEGRHFMCIKNYDSYLRQHYGDYMQLPSEDKRKPVHLLEAYWK